ncbi:uncharacterized membrane protein YjjB (DUF3815 family) [Methanolinea mesophila]|uniref:threonine/serine exporter family protein n=1 Tax=Methanolinea mesophila TaxID=547055 RepID=UPI001AE5AA23|nr:threonine/serine exporter family protein [Methanolinea mesophila]MBP1929985.1 uncharacterized membrane protein YjjB (DUF3815 family) [Methanolinea mesophila]
MDETDRAGPVREVTGTASDNRASLEEILTAELDLGTTLFSAGSPGQRILDSLTVLNEKLRGGRMHVLLGFEALVISLEREGEQRVGMRQFPLPTRMNGQALFGISEYLHSLPSRVDPDRVTGDLRDLGQREVRSFLLPMIALVVFTAIFGYFNRADAWALVIISIAALLAGLTRELVVRYEFNYYIGVLTATLVATISAALLSQVIPTGTPLVSLIIPCIFLIPGFQLINAGWEIMRNHMHIGIPRLMVFFAVLAIMSVGLLVVLLLYSPPAGSPGFHFRPELDLIIYTLLGALAALSFCVLMRAPRQAFLICLLCGGVGRLTRTVLVEQGGSGYAGVFFGTLVLTILAILICTRIKLPVVIPLVAASVQFIPGYYYILTLQDMASIIRLGTSVPFFTVASMISNGLLTLFISVAIVFGSLLPMLIMNRKTRFY